MGSIFHSLAKPTIHYCEPNLNGWVIEPANAGSSLFISLVGVYILAKKRHIYSVYLGAIAIILGLASFFYYASFTFIGQLADLGSMYLLASLLIVAALRCFKLAGAVNFGILVVGTVAPLSITAYVRTVNNFNVGIPLFAILLIIAVCSELQSAKIDNLQLKFFALTFVAFAVGYFFWWLDYKKIWCLPSSSHYINGHAVWHLSNAVALLLLDRHYAQLSRPATSTT